MASDMKGFFRQQKKNKSGGIVKPKSSSKKNSSASDVVQPPALVSHGSFDLQDEYDDKEEVLRQFDVNMAYGPCLGMSRLERWERANAWGLHPPKEVKDLLGAGKVNSECLWGGRV
ncbi:hypothetical protein BUALT_Bualt06G0147800 [Buddleja alternifolia]|uniref:DNA polymerase delta subunit 4 n=1 Tax=Buddleja alternifolia TaxID=168488 RepID=A0AAV6XMA6_9LAMI|nr:hypothetical protein BUALT_Bualt06G0147800 [Buddleja alternifolia]